MLELAFQNRVAFLNQMLGISQREIADRLGASQPMVNNMTKGLRVPDKYNRALDELLEETLDRLDKLDVPPAAEPLLEAILAYGETLVTRKRR